MDALAEHKALLAWLFALSLLLFFGTLAAIPLIVVRMRADYFKHREPPPDSFRAEHPALRIAVLVVKNALGAVFVVAGLAMLVLPGQGILSILVGISLLNFPGKRKLELRIVRSRPVYRAINWMRARAGRPPLELPDKES